MRNSAKAVLVVFLGVAALSATAQISKFKHVIIVFQENRTPDNLFQGLCAPPYGTSASCSTAPSGKQYNIQTSNWLDKTQPGGLIQPLPMDMITTWDMGHDHRSFVNQCNKDATGHCRMDGAAGVICAPNCQSIPQPAFHYVDYTTGKLNQYLDLATQYGFGNYMFQTNQGPSFPAHQFIFGATSAPSLEDDHAGTYVAENGGSAGHVSGCLSEPSVTVQLIDANGVEDPSRVVFPCFERNTLSDLLDSAGVTWRYYTPGFIGIWTAPNAIDHICQANNGQCTGPLWNNVDIKSSNVLSDISNCSLRQVSWVMPSGDNSDHANDTTWGGPSWVASIVNAIGNSWTDSNHKCDYWGNNTNDATAIIVTWDDWGGWYDHEPPPTLAYPQGGYQYGIRVPLLVVSAYTAPQTVSNVRYDFGSIIRFTEQNFNIQAGALSFADSRTTGNLREFFRVNQPPRPFKTIATPKSAGDFINDTSPQTDPDDY